MLVGKAEVSLVFGFVNGLLHGTQQHGLDEFAVFARGDCVGQCGVVFGGGRIAAAECESQQAELFAQVGEFFGGGTGVVAVKGGVFVFEQEVGGADVGGEHAFFYQFVRVVADNGDDTLYFAVVVENHLGFNGFKLHCAALAAFFLQNFK